METLYIVMPAYNEQENIAQTVSQWHPVVEKAGNNSKLVIVDDGSKDETYATMCSMIKQFPLLIPLTKPNSGHGPTLLSAYDYAINAKADYIFQTDSDGQTNPEEFWQFWKQRDEYDFIIGDREKRMDGLIRIFTTKILKLVILFIFRTHVPDCNTPFRLMNTQKLIPILELIPKDFFLSNVLISTIAVKRNEKICWLPITFLARKAGKNSINVRRIIKIGMKALGDFVVVNKRLKTK